MVPAMKNSLNFQRQLLLFEITINFKGVNPKLKQHRNTLSEQEMKNLNVIVK